MDKRVIEKFAVSARKQLIEDIGLRLEQLGIDENGASDKEDRSTREAEFYANQTKPLTGAEIGWRQAIVNRLAKTAKNDQWATAYTDLVEEVAYTWFNRIIAIRFMEVNDYLPSHVRVLSSIEGRNEPDIMTEALDISEYLGDFTAAEKQVYDDAWAAQVPAKMDKLYRMLFLKQIDALNENLPKLFEKTDDYMKLLFTPSYNNGVIKTLVTEVPEADFDVEKEGQVEIIGWLYQYYNEEPHNQVVNINGGPVKKNDIPAATQLFTTDWVVRYMVDNSLGRFYLEHNEQSTIADKLKYLLPGKLVQSEDTIELKKIKVLDNAMGSGHILVYAFDVLMEMYLEQGYSKRDAAVSIIQNNLYGLEIDRRAYQLAYFALMMKLRQYHRRALTMEIVPNIYVFEDTDDITVEDINSWNVSETAKKDLAEIANEFSNARTLGSIIKMYRSFDIPSLKKELSNAVSKTDLDVFAIDRKINVLSNTLNIVQLFQTKFEVLKPM